MTKIGPFSGVLSPPIPPPGILGVWVFWDPLSEELTRNDSSQPAIPKSRRPVTRHPPRAKKWAKNCTFKCSKVRQTPPESRPPVTLHVPVRKISSSGHHHSRISTYVVTQTAIQNPLVLSLAIPPGRKNGPKTALLSAQKSGRPLRNPDLRSLSMSQSGKSGPPVTAHPPRAKKLPGIGHPI